MKKLVFAIVIAGTVVSPAVAADMVVKSPPAATPNPPWDVAITGAVATDYNFRGVTQSNHQPSLQVGLEPRYEIMSNVVAYAGFSTETINFPNNATSELDFYAGIRPTFDKLTLDGGIWYYYYPSGQCFNAPAFCGPGSAALANGNTVKASESFYEWYGKATYAPNEKWSFGGSVWYSPSVLNSGARGLYSAGNVTYTIPDIQVVKGVGAYVSADAGYWSLGTTDPFYGIPGTAFAGGVPFPSYWNWDAGFGFTWKAMTLDLRYYGTNLSRAQCNVFTSDQTATFSAANVTPTNPGGNGSNWCSAAFIARLSIATSVNALR